MSDSLPSFGPIPRRAFIPLPLACLFFLHLAALPLFGHATLSRSEPASGAVLAAPPRHIQLEFSEAVEADFNGIAVYNSNGMRVDAERARVDSSNVRAVEVQLPHLPNGVYTVAWHVISADGHPIEGVFGFAVGDATIAGHIGVPRLPLWKRILLPLAGLTHALAILGLLLLAGIPMFYLLVFRPVARNSAGEARDLLSDVALQPRLGLTLRLVLALAVTASVGLLLIEALRVAGDEALSLSLLYRLAMRTRYGQMWSLRLTGLLLAALLSWELRKEVSQFVALRWYLLSLVAALLLFTPGLGGHPGAAPGRAAAILVAADWLHLLAAAPWVAGLWFFALLVPRLTLALRPALRALLILAMVARFPYVALTSVGLLLISGIVGAVEHIPSWAGLFYTAYGQAILVKVALLVPVLALAASHHLVFRKRLGRTQAGGSSEEAVSAALASFRRTVAVEFALVASILLAAGLLVNLPPAEATLAAARKNSFEQSQESAGLRLTLRVYPARIGLNTAEVSAVSLDNSVILSDLQLNLSAVMLAHKMGTQELTPHRVAPGNFRSDELMLGMSGPWEVAVQGAFEDGREIQAKFRFYVPPSE